MADTYQQQNATAQQNSAKNEADNNLVTSKVTRAIWIFASVLDALLGFRFLLKLFAANPSSLFAQIVYAATDFLVYPFHNLVSNPSIGNGVLEVTTLIAMLVYIFLTWLGIQLALLIFKR